MSLPQAFSVPPVSTAQLSNSRRPHVSRHRNRRHEAATGRGAGDGAPLVALERFDGRPGTRRRRHSRSRSKRPASKLIARHAVSAIGIGFGGPVDSAAGTRDQEPSDRRLGGLSTGRVVPPAIRHSGPAAERLRRGRAGRGAIRRRPRTSESCSTSPSAPASAAGWSSTGGSIAATGPSAAEIGHLRPGSARRSRRRNGRVAGQRLGHRRGGAVARLPNRTSQPSDSAAGPPQRATPEHVRNKLIDGRRRRARNTRPTCCRAAAATSSNSPPRWWLRPRPTATRSPAKCWATPARPWAGASRRRSRSLRPSVVVIGGGVSLMDESLFLLPLRKRGRALRLPAACSATCARSCPPQLGEASVVQSCDGSRWPMARRAGTRLKPQDVVKLAARLASMPAPALELRPGLRAADSR